MQSERNILVAGGPQRRARLQREASPDERDVLVAGGPQRCVRLRQEALAELAAEHHGVVARHELVSLGFSDGEIKGMLGASRLHRTHRGVYAVGHLKVSEKGWWMAAVLACGRESMLGHRSGAALSSLRRGSHSR